MSLLMDALKKAEQEKKEAANRLKESEEQNLQDKDINAAADTGEEQEIISREITGEHKKPLTEEITRRKPDDRTLSTMELSLAPIEELAGKPAGKGPAAAGMGKELPESEDVTLNISTDDLKIDQGDKTAVDVGGEYDVAGHEAAIHEGQAMLDETFHGVSFDGQADNPELFQETIQGEAYMPREGVESYEETLPGVSALQLAKDLGGGEDQPTPVAAKTIFTAAHTVSKTPSGFKWLILGLFILVIISGAVWYYYTVTPVNRELPSPLVARGIERIVPVADLIQQEPAVISGTVTTQQQAPAPDITAPEQQPAEEQISGTSQSGSGIIDQTAAQTTEAQPAADEEMPAAVAAETPAQGPLEIAGVPDQGIPGNTAATLPQTIELTPALIKISRSKTSEEKGQLINEAYMAYQANDYETARSKYSEVLKEYPNNRDALLGMGAIAVNNNRIEEAYMLYSRALRINPKDDFVRAILINLQSKADLLDSESAIKNMLYNNPEQPYLYYTLGNIYASQERWAEAQQAFFDAYRNDSSNPDYALNLAISLDHAGQAETALDYYNVALKLADEKSVNFDPAIIMARIKALSGTGP